MTSGDVGGRCTTAPQSAQNGRQGLTLPQEVQRSLTKAKPTVQGEGWSTANCRTSKEVMNLDYSAMSASYSAALSNASSARDRLGNLCQPAATVGIGVNRLRRCLNNIVARDNFTTDG